ncbi:rRNA maturation RNase YbeY [Paenibacillus thalictri]|uniref:Endoribonuclease YbeY n=1 Tax=Paenibacillus thalictri TaxID=2527873 RepID=A0A4V2J2X4_9BACL|nr:rRNA maturation RNase YbeY [Paenibacillus thalictri]TBL67604.1 rRNA maturation RNase YbeY [Paenibacillus thalictri]
MALILEWNNEQNQVDIPESLFERLNQLLQIAGELERVTDGEVALTLVDDAEIHGLNKQYRGIDRPTDVLSFAMQEMGDDELEIVYETDESDEAAEDASESDGQFEEPLGDIIISVERAVQQAEEYGHSFERELGFLFVHGFLHLIGYDHQDEAEEKKMFGKQDEILEKAGLLR